VLKYSVEIIKILTEYLYYRDTRHKIKVKRKKELTSI